MPGRNPYTLHANICQTLAHPKRLEVVDRLRGWEMSATALAEALEVSQPNLSQHLTLVRQKRIDASRRARQDVYYRLASPKIVKACDLMREPSVEHLGIGLALARGLMRERNPPTGHYNIERMLRSVAQRGEVVTCGTCQEARGREPERFVEGERAGPLDLLGEWTLEADHVLVF
jgi:DNA-binding transcriptional ArsR family regulator